MTERALRPDCASCVALCCVGLAFARSTMFAYDKPVGQPCRNLAADDRCTIHDHLPTRGFSGCVAFDCYGAGQYVTQQLFHGRTWRDDPATAASMFGVFPIIRQLHELLWYLDEAIGLATGHAIVGELEQLRLGIEQSTTGDPDEIEGRVDVGGWRVVVSSQLQWVSHVVRSAVEGEQRDLAGRDLAGRDLRRESLRGATLRGAVLIAADLRRADLYRADLLGADLRDADLRGADLSGAFFVTQYQLDSARGDGATRVPPGRVPSLAWSDQD